MLWILPISLRKQAITILALHGWLIGVLPLMLLSFKVQITLKNVQLLLATNSCLKPYFAMSAYGLTSGPGTLPELFISLPSTFDTLLPIVRLVCWSLLLVEGAQTAGPLSRPSSR